MSIQGDLTEIVTALKGAGVAATADASRLELPGILVMPSDMTFDTVDGSSYVQSYSLWLMARDLGPIDTWGELDTLLQATRSVLSRHITEATPINRPLANQSSEPVPALLVTLELRIS